jgi:hypothetical protein
MKLLRSICHSVSAVALFLGIATQSQAVPINVITVDVTPFVSPGGSSFGPQNTMGMALAAVDQGGDFIVTEVTPAAFAALPAAVLATYDLIAMNNHPARIAGGIGATWQGVVGVASGGRVMLTSHDAPRFHMLAPSPGPPLFTGNEPFGAPDLIRQAALWAGGAPGLTGLLIFNDAPAFVGGTGWNNVEMNLPAAWGIADLDAFGGSAIVDGGYTSVVASPANAVYNGALGVALSTARFAPNSISSFSANIGDGSFHTIFGAYNAGILTPSELVINSGIIDVGGFGVGNAAALAGLDGTPITLVRQAIPEPSSLVLAGLGLVGLMASAYRLRLSSNRQRGRKPV